MCLVCKNCPNTATPQCPANRSFKNSEYFPATRPISEGIALFEIDELDKIWSLQQPDGLMFN